MTITDIYDAADLGNYGKFLRYYKKYHKNDVNVVNEYTGLNLLQTTVCSDDNPKGKMKIIDFLLSKGIDINYLESRDKMNALHILYSLVIDGSKEFLFAVTKKLIEGGININQRDGYGAIPLSYLISVCQLDTEDLKELFEYLLEKGADYDSKDNYGKTCLDYANEFSWRKGFVEMVEDRNDR